MNLQQKLNQGSALIITLLVITVVSAIVFSTGRLALGELKLASQLEESDQAYYAAESGIETGLLMFRFNHDVETSQGATKTEGKPIRFDLANNKVEKASVTTPSSEKSVFDLKDWYKSDKNFICVPAESCDDNGNSISFTADKPALAKDETVEYDLSGVDEKLMISWEYTDDHLGDTNKQNQMVLEYTIYDKDGQIDNNGKNKDSFKFIYRSGRPITFTSNAKTLRLKSWGENIKNYKIEGFSDDKLDTRYTTIESTGYYGGTKRKLQITLDRTTGTLLGLHDFALFGSSNITVP